MRLASTPPAAAAAATENPSTAWALPPLNQLMTLHQRRLFPTLDNLLNDEDEHWTTSHRFVLPHVMRLQDVDRSRPPTPNRTQQAEEIDLTVSSDEESGGQAGDSDEVVILETRPGPPQSSPLRRKRRRPGSGDAVLVKRQCTDVMHSAASTDVSIHNSDVVEEFKARLKCSICLEGLQDMTSTLCGHIFCAGCIHQAIRANGKCPLCQRRLHLKDTHRLFF